MRCDREGRQGGGVALYVREDLSGDILCPFDWGLSVTSSDDTPIQASRYQAE